MKFYGRGLVWDTEKDKPLARFTDGELETDNIYVVEKLIAAGYEYEREAAIEEPAPVSVDVLPEEPAPEVVVAESPPSPPVKKAVKKK